MIGLLFVCLFFVQRTMTEAERLKMIKYSVHTYFQILALIVFCMCKCLLLTACIMHSILEKRTGFKRQTSSLRILTKS